MASLFDDRKKDGAEQKLIKRYESDEDEHIIDEFLSGR